MVVSFSTECPRFAQRQCCERYFYRLKIGASRTDSEPDTVGLASKSEEGRSLL